MDEKEKVHFHSGFRSKIIQNERTDLSRLNLMQNGHKMVREKDIVGAQEFKWRSGAATFWSVLLIPLILVMFEILVHVEIFHPFMWIQGAISDILSWKFTLLILPFQTLCIISALFHHKCTKVYPVHQRRNWDKLLFILHPKQLSWILMNSVVGMLFTALLHCLSYETHDFFKIHMKYFLLFGFILGSRYGVCFYTEKKCLIQFPILQEQRLVRFRASLPLCLKSAVIESLKTMKVCFILYIISSFLEKAFDLILVADGATPSMIFNNSVTENISLLWLCLIFGTTTLMILHVTQTLIEIFATQAYPFILESSFVGDQRLLLQDSLYSRHELLKHLAFFDLCICSKYDSSRRKQIFSITQPGGHPETWNLVLPQCLSVIENSKQRFAEATVCKAKTNNASLVSDLFSPDKTTTEKGHFMSPGAQNSVKASLFSQHRDQSDFSSQPLKPLSTSMFSPQKNWCSTEDVKCSIKNQAALPKTDHKRSFSKKIPLFPWFFEELPEYKTQELFQDHQLITWVLEGLSSLVASSFNEDTYGVVQRNLPNILVCLLSYLETIETYIKTTVSEDRSQLNKLREFQKRKSTNSTAQSYRIAVQSAIYKITTKFGKNLDYGVYQLQLETLY